MGLSYTQPIVVGTLTYSDTIFYQAPTPISVVDAIASTEPDAPPITNVNSVNDIKLTDITVGGTLWFAELPPGTATPYAVLFSSSIVPSGKTTGYTAFRSSYQISVFSDTRNDAVLRAKVARTKFDKKTIYEDLGGKVQTQSGPVRSEIAKGLGLNGVDAWMASFNLDVFYNRI